MRIVHVITGLGNGGAERTLSKICAAANSKHVHSVISLTPGGIYQTVLRRNGVQVTSLNFRLTTVFVDFLLLVRALKKHQPDRIHAWMPHACLVSSMAASILGGPKVFWGLRASSYGTSLRGLPTRIIVRFLAWKSPRWPHKILCVGQRTLELHAKAGFDPHKMVVIENGFSTNTSHTAEATTKPKSILPFPQGAFVIGSVARFHEKKGHLLLLDAFAHANLAGTNGFLALAGDGVDVNNKILTERIKKLAIQDRVILLGPLAEPSDLYEELSVHVSASIYGEGFPNTVAESMSVGVPNVVTDVGESRVIVSSTGWVCAPGDEKALSAALETAARVDRKELEKKGKAAAHRIRSKHSLAQMVSSYEAIYSERFVAAFPRYARNGASSRVRMYQFERYLNLDGWTVEFHPLVSETFLSRSYAGIRQPFRTLRFIALRIKRLRESRGSDIIWVSRESLPWFPAFVERLITPQRNLIYDYDDAVHVRYTSSPNPLVRRMLGGKILELAQSASHVVAGNRFLEAYFASATQTSLVPSTINRTRGQQATLIPNSGSRARFGWIGTPSTWREYVLPKLSLFLSIAEALDADFCVMGSGPVDHSSPRLKIFEWKLEEEREFLQTLSAGIMPLDNGPWAQGKCGYKLLEYLAVGIPVVASPLPVNAGIIEAGECGFTATSDEDWSVSLSKLLREPEVARRMGRNGHRFVEKNFDARRWASELSNIFTAVVGK